MHKRWKDRLKAAGNKKGAAMIMVLCVMAVFLALAVSILLAGSVAMNVAKQSALAEQCKVQAVTFSNVVDAAMEDKDSDICQYLKQQISGGGWNSFDESNQDSAAAAIREYSIDNTYFPMEMEMYWTVGDNQTIAPGSVGNAQGSYDQIFLFIDVICSMDDSKYQVQSRYRLADNTLTEGVTEPEWRWTLQGRK